MHKKFELHAYQMEWLQQSVIPTEIIQRYRVIPLERKGELQYVGLADPTDAASIAAIGFHTGLRIHALQIDAEELDQFINTHCQKNVFYAQLESSLAKITRIEDDATPPETSDHDDEPVIEFVNHLLHEASTNHISDIHIEPYASDCRIRFRRDGLLYEAATIPIHLYRRMTARLKIMAQLNITERRLPQDGRIQVQLTNKVDIRISICPILSGEKIVLRLLNNNHAIAALDTLGMHDFQLALLMEKLQQPQGLILVTGPTGSGKTTTLYAALHHLNQIDKNISTVEDPVEIEIAGINQVNINPNIDLDFATILRTFLRQDPDIIMVGEIRDNETATIAMQAAQTGHLVLSTLHTNSASETIARLQSMNIAPYQIIHSISLIISQRLLRRLCRHCKQIEMTATGYSYRALGCKECRHGYDQRIGVFECVAMSGYDFDDMTAALKRDQFQCLRDSAERLIHAGITSYAEVARVLGA